MSLINTWPHDSLLHCEMLHPEGGTKYSILDIIWDSEHQRQPFHWVSRGQELHSHHWTFWGRADPFSTRSPLQEFCSHHSIGLLPPPWLTGCLVVSWLCQFEPAFSLSFFSPFFNFSIKLLFWLGASLWFVFKLVQEQVCVDLCRTVFNLKKICATHVLT